MRTPISRRVRRWALTIPCASAIMLGPVSVSSAQEKIIVPRAGHVSWADLVRHERANPPVEIAGRAQHAPLPGRPVREIGRPPGMDDVPARKPGPAWPPEESAGGCVALPDLALQANFQALSDNNTSIPPDTHGAAGPNHLMTILNTEVGIQSRSGVQISRVSLSTFWTAGTGITGNPFDPSVLYDPLSDRWLATCVANSNSASSEVFFAISDTNDPTGMWSFFEIDADPADVNWADFPGFGVNSTWIAITNNMFSIGGSPSFDAVKMWVIDKSTALAGGPLTVTVFPEGFDLAGGFDSFTMKPAQTFDAAEPNLNICSSPGVTTGGIPLLRLSRIVGTGPSPTWQVIPGSAFAGSGLFSVVTDFQFTLNDATQAGGATLVDTGDRRILNTVYRNGRLWATHAGGLPASGSVDRTAVFWYEFDPASGSPLVQSGVIDPGEGGHVFYPSISVNCNNDMCVGFSRSDAARFVEGVYTGRLAADPAGTTRPVTVIKAGESFYSKFFGGTKNRWGDYSATVVDPVDDESFWTIQEYAADNVGPGVNDGRWGTWWARIGAPPTCLGDTNGDLFVDVLDLLALLGAWGPCPPPCPPDFDASGDVDVLDLLALLGAWGPCPIPNDLLANAQPIGVGAVSFNNAPANTDGPPDCPDLTNDLWYCYFSPCTGTARISLCGSSFDTVLAVYDGCGSTTTQLACFDDDCGLQSEALVPVTLGQQLLIRVGGKSGAAGAGTLTVTCENNDSCSTPESVGLGNIPYDTSAATTDGPPLPIGCDEGSGIGFVQDLWYVYTPGASGTLTVSTCNQASYDTRLAAYTGACGSLTLVECNDDFAGCGLTSEMSFAVSIGVPVLIRVGGFAGLSPSGTGTLSLSQVGPGMPARGAAPPAIPPRSDEQPAKKGRSSP